MDAGWLSFKSIKVDSTPCLVFYFVYLIFPYINKYHFSNGYYDRSKEQRMHLISEVNHPCIPRFPDPWHVGRKPMNYYHRNVKTLQFVSAQSVADLRAFLSFLKRKKKHFATILRGGGREGGCPPIERGTDWREQSTSSPVTINCRQSATLAQPLNWERQICSTGTTF